MITTYYYLGQVITKPHFWGLGKLWLGRNGVLISHSSLTGMLLHSTLHQMEWNFNPHSEMSPDSGVRTPRSATPKRPVRNNKKDSQFCHFALFIRISFIIQYVTVLTVWSTSQPLSRSSRQSPPHWTPARPAPPPCPPPEPGESQSQFWICRPWNSPLCCQRNQDRFIGHVLFVSVLFAQAANFFGYSWTYHVQFISFAISFQISFCHSSKLAQKTGKELQFSIQFLLFHSFLLKFGFITFYETKWKWNRLGLMNLTLEQRPQLIVVLAHKILKNPGNSKSGN